jgi:hydrogenase-4 component B
MMASLMLLATFFGCTAAGIIVVWCVPRRGSATALAYTGAICSAELLAAGATGLLSDAETTATLWQFAPIGVISVGVSPFQSLFILITGAVGLPVSIFSASYLAHYARRYSLRYFALLYHAFLAAMIAVLIAHDILSFLLFWEAMSLLAYLLVTFETDSSAAAHAGLIMLAMSEIGLVLAIGALLLLANSAGSIDFTTIRAAATHLGVGLRLAVFLLSFVGFGVKAGLVPLNSWLPLAHPVAPTDVSALLSAVMVNLGIYGIALVNVVLMPPVGVGPGLLVLAIGAMTALLGILYATIQPELKCLLAHSTIENMGIIAAMVGAAMVFLSAGQAAAANLALLAALYHLLNHSLYKALLFTGAGAIQSAAGTRDLDRLGGLIHRMRWTALLVLGGVMAISALPPFNGFVSEWLSLQAILRAAELGSKPVRLIFALSGALLALTAGLAITCFIKVFALGFLGLPRTQQAASAREAPATTRWAMGLLGAACLILGILPTYVIPGLDHAIRFLSGSSVTAVLVPPFFTSASLPPAFVADFHAIGAQVGQHLLPGRGLVILLRGGVPNPVVFAISPSYGVVVFLILLGILAVIARRLTRHRHVVRQIPWAGGIGRLVPVLTYSASAFANPVRVVFHAVLRPQLTEEAIEDLPMHFTPAVRRSSTETHIVDRLLLQPALRGIELLAQILRRMHLGAVNVYASYVLGALLVAFAIWAGSR